MARERRKERITVQREEQILSAALVVFTEKGFAGATIPDIAGEAGIAVGTIYNYFQNKRELFVAVIKKFIFTAPLLDLIDEMPRGDIAGVLRQIIVNRITLIDSADAYNIPSLMTEAQRDPELKDLWLRDFLQPFMAKLEKMYTDLAKSGKYSRQEPAVTVRAVGGMILGFLMLRIMEGEHSPLNKLPQDTITDTLTHLLMHGLLNNEEKQSSGGPGDE